MNVLQSLEDWNALRDVYRQYGNGVYMMRNPLSVGYNTSTVGAPPSYPCLAACTTAYGNLHVTFFTVEDAEELLALVPNTFEGSNEMLVDDAEELEYDDSVFDVV